MSRSPKREAHLDEVVRLRAAGVPKTEVARRVGVSVRSVCNWMRPEPYQGALTVHRSTPSWETANWANAAEVAAWVDAKVAPERIAACGLTEDLSAWRTGGATSFWKVDRVFVKLALHVAQLPDDVWRAHRRG